MLGFYVCSIGQDAFAAPFDPLGCRDSKTRVADKASSPASGKQRDVSLAASENKHVSKLGSLQC